MSKINKDSVFFTDYTKNPHQTLKLFGRANIAYFIPDYDAIRVNKLLNGQIKFDPKILMTLKCHCEAINRIILNDGDDPEAIPLTDESWAHQFECSFENYYRSQTAYHLANKLFEQLQEIL